MDIDDDERREAVIGALGRYQSEGNLATARSELAKAIENESQRGLVIILVSFVEDALQERIWRASQGQGLSSRFKAGTH